jgi:hypothetical protein
MQNKQARNEPNIMSTQKENSASTRVFTEVQIINSKV